MPFQKKRCRGAVGYKKAKKKKTDEPDNNNSTTSPELPKEVELAVDKTKHNNVVNTPDNNNKQNAKAPSLKKISIQELLDIFKTLQRLDDKQLRSAVVNGCKNLENFVHHGKTIAKVSKIITIHDDDDDDHNDSRLPHASAVTQQEEAIPQTPTFPRTPTTSTPITYSLYQQPDASQLIELDENCFTVSPRGNTVSYHAARRQRARCSKRIVDAVLNKHITNKQQVLALRDAMLHPDIRAICCSAGVAMNESIVVNHHLCENMKLVMKLLTQTTHQCARSTNDKRSVIQSVVLATLPPPLYDAKKPSERAIAAALGLSRNTFARFAKAATPLRAMLEAPDADNKETVYSQVLKANRGSKLSKQITNQLVDFVRGHPFVVASPIKGDSVLVPDDRDPSKKVRKNKLLLQIPVRELMGDLLKKFPQCKPTGYAGVINDDDVLLSDWKLRRLLPPELRRMSNYYKTMCACIVCVQMKLHQATYKRFHTKKLKEMKEEVDAMVLGTRSRMAALKRYNQHKDQCDQVKTIRDALKAVHCKPVGTATHDMFHINCAFNHCPRCPNLKQPTQEKNCADPIAFQTYELVDYCTEHSTLPTGLQVCPVCAHRRPGEKKELSNQEDN